MKWKRLTAVFGALDNDTLELKEGFNLIYAPNESGKSTWCAFLRTMLYGLPTRDRRQNADKTRYAPWSGHPMEGRADLTHGSEDLTIIRNTARNNSPMGQFSAYYSGTATPVPLSSATCGEVLTGVPREVFERSAFIGQNSIVIDQDTELERRIAALISSGDESTSYTEASERLKKQLTQRRYHKTGLLPTLESEIAALNEKLLRSRSLHQQLLQAQKELTQHEQQEDQLLHSLTDAASQAETDTHRQYALLQRQAEQADALVREHQTTVESLPSRKELAALKSAAGNILVNQLTLRNAQDQVALREKEQQEAQLAVDTFPLFSGLTGEEAKTQAAADHFLYQTYCRQSRLFALITLLPLMAAAILAISLASKWLTAPLWFAALPLLLIPIPPILSRRRKQQARQLLAAYGEQEPDFSRQAETYYIIYERFTQCRNAKEASHSRVQSLREQLALSRAEVIVQAQKLDGSVSDLSSATAAIDSAIAAWRKYETARQTQEQLYERCETLAAIVGDQQPQNNTDALRQELLRARQASQECRGRIAALESQLRLTGREVELLTTLAEKEQRRTALEQEYAAISMALSSLTAAHTTLQNRFSPELGKKAAKYFAKLTKGKYNTVLLSRELTASAQEAASPMARPFWQLSQGAMEQLYLATRLAICDLVLPEDKSVPLVLDDALCSFDDERMAAALDLLLEISQRRQILFFTCQRREEAYLTKTWPGRFSLTELGNNKAVLTNKGDRLS